MRARKRRSVLKQQNVRRKKRHVFRASLKAIALIGAGALKVMLLVILLATTSLALLSAYHYLLNSPYLKLKRVEMDGVDKEFKQDLVRRCGLNWQLTLLALDLNELKQKMEDHPWVRSVKLERQFPNTLIAKVEREIPRALVLRDKLYYMNQWGELFKEVKKSEEKDYPVITGVPSDQKNARKQLERVAQVIRNLELEKGQWSVKRLSEIHVRKDGGLSLYYNHIPAEINVMWDGVGTKMGELKRVVAHLTKTGRIHEVKGIDLGYREGIVVSFKKG